MTIFDPAPTLLENVVSPEWLTAMLRARWPDATVLGVEAVELLVTQATKIRLKLDVAGAPDAPTRLCIKGVLTATGAPAAASIVETLFYANPAADFGVHVPPCIHASLNAAGANGVIVMHDVIAGGARFCTALEAFTIDAARDGLDRLAQLHATAWQGRPLYELAWVPRFLDMIATRPLLPGEALQALLDGPRGTPLPLAVRDADRLQRGLESLAGQVRKTQNCLVHGDAHAGNLFREADGRLGLVDWQILQKGEWAQDVAYHLAAVLTPEDRRAHERELLAYYLDRLASLGGPVIDATAAWTRYRAGMVYGFYLWAVTRKVEPAIIHEFVRRLGLAVDDLDSFAAAGL